jgi:hypothetical protein
VAFIQKYSFASARVLAQHVLTSVPTIEEVLQGELGLKISRGAGCPVSCPAQKLTRIEVSAEMPRILYESEENLFKGIATGDES